MDPARISNIRQQLALVEGQDDATATATLSVGTRVPRSERITATTAGAALGGANAAALQAGLRKAQASSDPQISAMGDYALGLLLGPGFDATDPSVPLFVQAFVAAGICTQESADAILYVRTDYPCGFIPTQEEVVEARRQDAREKAINEANAAAEMLLVNWRGTQPAVDGDGAVQGIAEFKAFVVGA